MTHKGHAQESLTGERSAQFATRHAGAPTFNFAPEQASLALIVNDGLTVYVSGDNIVPDGG
jgi:hypothetical protein